MILDINGNVKCSKGYTVVKSCKKKKFLLKGFDHEPNMLILKETYYYHCSAVLVLVLNLLYIKSTKFYNTVRVRRHCDFV